jgi:hypothetical protein
MGAREVGAVAMGPLVDLSDEAGTAAVVTGIARDLTIGVTADQTPAEGVMVPQEVRTEGTVVGVEGLHGAATGTVVVRSGVDRVGTKTCTRGERMHEGGMTEVALHMQAAAMTIEGLVYPCSRLVDIVEIDTELRCCFLFQW